MKIINAERPTYFPPEMEVIALNANDCILYVSNGNQKGEQLDDDVDGWGDDFWC